MIGSKYIPSEWGGQIHFIIYDKFDQQTNRWSRLKQERTNTRAPGNVTYTKFKTQSSYILL